MAARRAGRLCPVLEALDNLNKHFVKAEMHLLLQQFGSHQSRKGFGVQEVREWCLLRCRLQDMNPYRCIVLCGGAASNEMSCRFDVRASTLPGYLEFLAVFESSRNTGSFR